MTLDGGRASFSSDGRWVVTTSSADARIWPVDPWQHARDLAPRELTPAERARYDLPPRKP